MAQILVEFKNKLNYVWENTNITLQLFAQKIAMFIGAYNKYKQITLGPADLIGLTSFEFLPALPAGQYYEFKINAELIAGSTPYDADVTVFYGTEVVDGILLTSTTSLVSLISSDEEELPFSENVTLQPAGPITAGNGTLTVKIWYIIHKIG